MEGTPSTREGFYRFPVGASAKRRQLRCLARTARFLHFLYQNEGHTCSTPLILAEGEGFEPPEAFTSTVFKTAAFDRSAILPNINSHILTKEKIIVN